MEDLKSWTDSRADVYRFFSLVYIREPDAEFISSLRDAETAKTFKALGFDIEAGIKGIGEEKVEEELLVEYTRLFIGPAPAVSVYESVWVEESGSLWGKVTSEVKRLVESSGLKYKPSWTGLPDHIGVELELMQKVIEGEALAREAGDEGKVRVHLEFEQRFMEEHIAKWIPSFCEKVIAKAKLPFYSEIAALTAGFIDFDRKEIGRLLKDK